MIFDEALPPHVESRLRDILVQRGHPLLLSFDHDWQLRDARGDAAFHGIDTASPERGVQQLQDLFTGLSLTDDQDIPFVELANGRSAHVHLIVDGDGFHVLLVDAEDARNRERTQQQLGHEAMLAGHEKNRAIGQLKEIRSQLERQRASLEEANALKNALIATMSHEFRTPLTSMFGYLHLLEQRTDADPARALQAIRRNATHLYALAENLLEYGRDEAGGSLLDPVAIDLAALRADLEAMFLPLAADKGIGFRATLDVADATVPRFDAVKLRQVAINLLSNALRYTSRGEVACALRWQDGRLGLEVRDSGIGIAPEFQDSVFRPFNRGAQEGSRGAGLGLSIVRRLIAQMHGNMQLESQVGVGTTFRIELPGAPAPKSAATDASERSVLVVDDDPDVADLLVALLQDLGYRTRAVADAEHAIAAAMADPPDVLLVDVKLPGMSGNAAVYRLRSQGYRGRVVMLSATATTAARDASLRAGADAYVTKPLNLEQFVATIAQVGDEKP